jgi:fatty acid desaturase/cytochrome b involved in lipid metabolism
MSQTMTATVTRVANSASNLRSPTKNNPAHHSLLASFVPPKTTSSDTHVVTLQELAEHDGVGSKTGEAWVCLHGHVFDITEFSKTHPGGPMIRLAAGRDATCLVESYHPQSSVVKVEAALFSKANYVGPVQLSDSDHDKSAVGPAASAHGYVRPDDSFFLDVRARVDSLINRELSSSRYHFEVLGLFECLATLSLYGVACYYVGVHGSWTWTLILGFLTGRMGFLMHMGNHCAISQDPTKNKYVGWFMDLIGSNAIIWGHEHQVAHHVEPNEYKKDNDCEIGNPTVRLHPEIPHTQVQKWQHIIVPIAMTIGFFKWYVGDFEHFVRKQVGNVRMAIGSGDWKQLLAFKIHWFILHVIIPVYFNGWKTALAQCFVFMAVGGHYLENIFIVNHVQNGLVPPPNAHWASKQVLATANWKSGSLFWNWFSGGLNHQIEHHMFPSLSHYWYPYIASAVEQCCKDHGLTYCNYPNFITAWVDMWTYLRDMGDENFVSRTGQKGAPAITANKKVHAL